ncbi:MAG: hypothetical protein CMJ20_04465 [Phycisphaeraceae bacterium]|nr:hypothetical protein [Phycisphaeraceae bacterium]|tara:strand:+ start:237 stop:1292 length:1056 start_codon:yes stop_codon:yes gene_type:complete
MWIKEIMPITATMALLILGCQANGQTTQPSPPPHHTQPLAPTIDFIQKSPLAFAQIIQPGDRILFVGDQLTQYRFYTRAVASALLCIMPDANLRFFNGGYAGATAASTIDWIYGLIELTRPTVIFVCLGLNDAMNLPGPQTGTKQYQQDLNSLIHQIQPHARQLVIISAPAVDTGIHNLTVDHENTKLHKMAIASQQIAQHHQVGFVDSFIPMRLALLSANRKGQNHGDLSINQRLLNEMGHVVLASAILYGIGVTAEQLEPTGWSPLLPRDMRQVRGILGLRIGVPDLSAAARSRDLYLHIIRFDEIFFEAWRLAPRMTVGPTQTELIAESEGVWDRVRVLTSPYAATDK